MADATTNVSRKITAHNATSVGFAPVKEAEDIPAGVVVSKNATDGYANNYNSGEVILGVSTKAANNSAGADAALHVELIREGIIHNVAVTGAADGVQEIGNKVYASDNQTFTLTAGSDTLFGLIDSYDAENATYNVYFKSGSRGPLEDTTS